MTDVFLRMEICPRHLPGSEEGIFAKAIGIRREIRDEGVGSRFLQALISGPLRNMDCVLLEVDDPACADTPEEADIRNRRLSFYLRNGLRDTDVKATVYGVQFKILTLPVGHESSASAPARAILALTPQSRITRPSGLSTGLENFARLGKRLG